MNTNNINRNLLRSNIEIAKNISFFLTTFIMFILIIITLVVIYTQGKKIKLANGPSGSSQSVNMSGGDIFLIVIGTISLVFLIFIYFKFPEFFRSILLVLTDSSYLIMLILYIIFLIVLYQNILTKEQINKYAYFIFPITVFFCLLLFYLNISNNIRHFLSINQTADRVKYTIVYFCLITVLFFFYYTNPNNYVSNYFGPYLVISLLLIIFGFLYLITLMSYPEPHGNENTSSLLSRFNPFTIFSVVSFLIFLILVTAGILSFPGGFLNSNASLQSGVFILIILVFVFWIISFINALFRGEQSSPVNGQEKRAFGVYETIFKNVSLLVFGLVFSGLLVYWIVYGVQSLTNSSGILSFILNLILILIALGLVFRILTSTAFYNNSPLARFIVNSIFYIPCLLFAFFENVLRFFGLAGKTVSKFSLSTFYSGTWTGRLAPNENVSTYYWYILLIIIAIVGYMIFPYLQEKIKNQGGLLLINQPVYLNQQHELASYQTLNNIRKLDLDLSNSNNPMQFNYKYAFSCWIYFDSTNPSRTNEYISILNYGNKPNILYNPVKNNFIFVFNDMNSKPLTNVSMEKITENGFQVVYEDRNMLLQKWNHIAMNYTGQRMDIFINGKLRKSVLLTIPYQTMDVLTVGTENGVQGGICNLNYFANGLNETQIYYLYQFFYGKNPPAYSSSQDTIINILEQIPNVVNNKPVEISTNQSYTDNLANTMNNITNDLTNKIRNNDISNNIIDYSNKNYLSWDWYSQNNKY